MLLKEVFKATGKDKRCWQSFFIGLSVVYLAGGWFIENSGSGFHWGVLVTYLLSGILATLFAALWVARCKEEFLARQQEEAGHSAVRGSARACQRGYVVVFLIALAAQLVPMIAYRPSLSIVWALSFAFTSSGVASGWAYFLVGYPAMASLDHLDTRYGSDVPSRVVEGLKAELEFLRIVMMALIPTYGLVILTAVFGFDKVRDIIRPGGSGEQIWFGAGVALLLLTFHLAVTGAVAARHAQIARWLRKYV